MLIGWCFKICRKVTTIFGYKQVFIIKKCRFFAILVKLVQILHQFIGINLYIHIWHLESC